MSQYETLLLEESEGIATVTVNRPKVLNALSRQTIQELGEAFTRLCGDGAVGGVILTGAGPKAFVAGADIGELQGLDTQAGREYSRAGQAVFNLIERLGKPVVAAINGFALGGGCELAMACTVRFASETARLGQPEVKLGLIPGYGGTQRLTRLLGPGRALDLLLSGRMMGAAEALAAGLVDRVVSPDGLMDESRKWLREVCQNSPLAVRLCLEAVRRGGGLTLDEALALETDLFGMATASADAREGTAAFLEKRPARFTGR